MFIRFINKSEPKRNALYLFWGLCLDESANVLPVAIAELLDGVQQLHVLSDEMGQVKLEFSD